MNLPRESRLHVHFIVFILIFYPFVCLHIKYTVFLWRPKQGMGSLESGMVVSHKVDISIELESPGRAAIAPN